jgi:hypothetical protein
MAVWCRINRFKLKHYSHQIQRYYLGIPNGASLNSNASHTGPCVVDKPYWVIHSGSTCFCNNVRFFAAPVQVMIWGLFADYLGIFCFCFFLFFSISVTGYCVLCNFMVYIQLFVFCCSLWIIWVISVDILNFSV